MVFKPDRARYFEQVACLERRKVHSVHEALAPVEDAYVSRVLLRIGANAAEHYTAILKLFDSKEFEEDFRDLRLNVRRSALGTVRITPKDREPRMDLGGYSVNLSSRGMCLETSHRIEVGERLDIRVMLYDALEPAECSGKVVWVRELFSGFYTLGVVFGA